MLWYSLEHPGYFLPAYLPLQWWYPNDISDCSLSAIDWFMAIKIEINTIAVWTIFILFLLKLKRNSATHTNNTREQNQTRQTYNKVRAFFTAPKNIFTSLRYKKLPWLNNAWNTKLILAWIINFENRKIVLHEKTRPYHYFISGLL